jgi:hypothetical protein
MPSFISRPGSGEDHRAWRVFLLWCGVLAGPIVWLVLLETNYVLSYVACETRQTWFLHLGTGIAVVVVASAGFLGWRAGHSPQGPPEAEHAAPISAQTCAGRARWMALFALVNSIWFVIVIVAMSVPVIVLRTCQ